MMRSNAPVTCAALVAAAADLEVALDDEDLLAGRVVVGGEARARLEAHQRGRMPAGVAPQALHRHAGDRQRLPLRAGGVHDGRTGRLGHGLSLVRADGSVNAHTWASVVGSHASARIPGGDPRAGRGPPAL